METYFPNEVHRHIHFIHKPCSPSLEVTNPCITHMLTLLNHPFLSDAFFKCFFPPHTFLSFTHSISFTTLLFLFLCGLNFITKWSYYFISVFFLQFIENKLSLKIFFNHLTSEFFHYVIYCHSFYYLLGFFSLTLKFWVSVFICLVGMSFHVPPGPWGIYSVPHSLY